ncbi:MAG: hypothetical protein ABW080_03145 [Candidatus Thiodiazotropha sp.]
MTVSSNSIDRFEITAGDESHYDAIVALFTSPEEFYLIYPSGSWPFDRSQLQRLATQRSMPNGDRVALIHMRLDTRNR